ncbi:MAG: hypothetical protein LAP40_27835 [Acidobacteriia bacterium]|nr:hypothetical protein [Terriglobia bacterium]
MAVKIRDVIRTPEGPAGVPCGPRAQQGRLGDALIAQSCIDRGIPLITRGRDLRTFAEAAGLDLVIGPAAS